MRHPLISLVPVLILVCVAALASAPQRGRPNHYTLRVSSSVPGTQIQFEGAYMFNGSDPGIHNIRQSTPFEVSADGALGVGVFRKTAGPGQIVVEVLRFVDDKQIGSSRSVDDGVIFGENLIDRYASFSHTFTWPVR